MKLFRELGDEYKYERLNGFWVNNRFTFAVHVPAGTTIDDGWVGTLTAPEEPGNYTCWCYCHDNTFDHYEWEKEEEQ